MSQLSHIQNARPFLCVSADNLVSQVYENGTSTHLQGDWRQAQKDSFGSNCQVSGRFVVLPKQGLYMTLYA